MYGNIKGSDLHGLIGKINIIDVRKNYFFNLGHIPTSINIPSSYLLMYPNRYLNKDKEYYIYCSQGIESVKVCSNLSNLGYKVVNVLGGYQDYTSNF